MDSSWFDVFRTVLLGSFLITIPGVIPLLVARVSYRRSAVAAPIISVGIIAVSAIVADKLHFHWNILVVIAGSIGAVLVAVGVRLLRKRPSTSPIAWRGSLYLFPICVVCAACVHIVRLVAQMKYPFGLSQTYDGLFHLNLVEFFVKAGTGSSLDAGAMTSGGASGFYPAAWHDLTSLLVQLTGVEIPVAANGVTIVITALLWPFSIGMLGGALTKHWGLASGTALLSCVFAQFPNLLTFFGVLYPNMLANSLIPLCIILLMDLLLQHSYGRAEAGVLAIIAAPIMVLCHPNAVFTIAVLVFPLFIQVAIQWGKEWGGAARIRQIMMITCGVVGVLIIYGLINKVSMMLPAIARLRGQNVFWHPETNFINALGRFIGTNEGWVTQGSGIIPWIVAPLVLIGCIRALWLSHARWFPFAHMLIGAFYIVCMSDQTSFRPYLTGFWYGDSKRIITIFGITNVCLLMIGLEAVIWFIRSCVIPYLHKKRPTLFLAHADISDKFYIISSSALFICVFVITQFGAVLADSYAQIGEAWDFDKENNKNMLSIDEYRLLERLPEKVPEDAVVIGHPWNGSSYALSIGQRKVLFPNLPISGDENAYYLAENLDQINSDPKVCELLEKDHVTYALDFGNKYLWGDDSGVRFDRRLQGLREIPWIPLGNVVDSQGDAKLIKITACG